jgi:hypothetical protein
MPILRHRTNSTTTPAVSNTGEDYTEIWGALFELHGEQHLLYTFARKKYLNLMDLPEEDMTRQNAYTDYLWAAAYANLGLIDAAATPAQDALVVMKQSSNSTRYHWIGSVRNVL